MNLSIGLSRVPDACPDANGWASRLPLALGAWTVRVWVTLVLGAVAATAGVFEEFRQRVDVASPPLPTITAAAEAAAQRVVADPTVALRVPHRVQEGFCRELSSRAGGLAAVASDWRPGPATAKDVLLLSVRAWDGDGAAVQALAERAARDKCLTVLFASKAGLPEGLAPDHLIDNGAPSGDAAHGTINALVNVMNAWVWVCEYTAALTRAGKYPGILLSIGVAGADEHNAMVRRADRRQYLEAAGEAIPAGRLGTQYRARVDRMLKDVGDAETRRQVQAAGKAIAADLAAGKDVDITCVGHLLKDEIFVDRRTGMTPFDWRRRDAFSKILLPGDLLVYFAYVGMNTRRDDLATPIRNAQVRLVCSYAPNREKAAWTVDAENPLVCVEQSWALPDAEVPVPFPPGHIAPISGIESGLLYRMLEEAVLAEN